MSIMILSLSGRRERLNDLDFLLLAFGFGRWILSRDGLRGGWGVGTFAAIFHREFNLVALISLIDSFLSEIDGAFRRWGSGHGFLEFRLRLLLGCSQLANDRSAQGVAAEKSVLLEDSNQVVLVDSAGKFSLNLCIPSVYILICLLKVANRVNDMFNLCLINDKHLCTNLKNLS